MIRQSLSFDVPLLVVLQLVTVFTITSAQVKPNLGKERTKCCGQEWQNTVGKLLEVYGKNKKLDDDFKFVYDKFIAPGGNFTAMNTNEDKNLHGLCFGLVNYICVPPDDKSEGSDWCKCNDDGPFKSSKSENGDHCVMSENSMCSINDGKSPGVPDIRCDDGMQCVMQDGVFPTCKAGASELKSPKVGLFLASAIATLFVTLNVMQCSTLNLQHRFI